MLHETIVWIWGLWFFMLLYQIRCRGKVIRDNWYRAYYILHPDRLYLGDCYGADCSDILGRGAYGVVMRGRNLCTQETVAIKEVIISEATTKFMTRELKFLNLFNHKNIVRFFDSKTRKKCIYFVMEYCQCGNLEEFVRNRPISLPLRHSFMCNLAKGMRYLHRKYISHRDIKPVNILVKNNHDDYFLVLADFGLARYFPASSSGVEASVTTGNITILCFNWP